MTNHTSLSSDVTLHDETSRVEAYSRLLFSSNTTWKLNGFCLGAFAILILLDPWEHGGKFDLPQFLVYLFGYLLNLASWILQGLCPVLRNYSGAWHLLAWKVVLYVFQPIPIHLRIPFLGPQGVERTMLGLALWTVGFCAYDTEIAIPMPSRYNSLRRAVSAFLLFYVSLLKILGPRAASAGFLLSNTCTYILFSSVIFWGSKLLDKKVRNKHRPRAQELRNCLLQHAEAFVKKEFLDGADSKENLDSNLSLAFYLEHNVAKHRFFEKLAMKIYCGIILALFAISFAMRLWIPFDQLEHSPQLKSLVHAVKAGMWHGILEHGCNLLFILVVVYLVLDIVSCLTLDGERSENARIVNLRK